MRWEDITKKNVEKQEGETDWEARSPDQGGWMVGYMMEWSLIPKKKLNLYFQSKLNL